MTDAELERWARRAVRGIAESATFCNIWNPKMRDDPFSDPLPLIQLGYAMFLDKPLVVLLPSGTELPEHLARAADRIITFDHDAPNGLEQATAQLSQWIKSTQGIGP